MKLNYTIGCMSSHPGTQNNGQSSLGVFASHLAAKEARKAGIGGVSSTGNYANCTGSELIALGWWDGRSEDVVIPADTDFEAVEAYLTIRREAENGIDIDEQEERDALHGEVDEEFYP